MYMLNFFAFIICILGAISCYLSDSILGFFIECILAGTNAPFAIKWLKETF